MKNFQLFVLVALASCSHGQRPSFLSSNVHTCVPDGQYCSVGADCCSKTCSTSPNNRCATTISNDVRPGINIPNRFGGCQGFGSNCNLGQDCCSRACSNFRCIEDPMSITEKPDLSNRNDFLQQQQQTNCRNIDQACALGTDCCMFLTCERNLCKDKAVDVTGTETVGFKPEVYFNNRFGEENANQSTQRPFMRCMDIGQKCYKHEECCSPLKCHSNLHQCVT